MELLAGIRPDVDFENETALIDDGILDSFDVVSIISTLDDEFDVEIEAMDIIPENFETVSAISKLIERLGDED